MIVSEQYKYKMQQRINKYMACSQLERLKRDLRGMIDVRQHQIDTWPKVKLHPRDDAAVKGFVANPFSPPSVKHITLVKLLEHEIAVFEMALKYL